MPNTIAQNKFAVHCGVTRQGIAWAVANKLIAVYKKKINIDHRLTCEYYHKQTGKTLDPAKLMKKVVRKKKAAPPVSKPPKPPKPKPSAPPAEPITAPIEDTPDPEVNPDIDLDKLDYENGYTLPDGINCFEDITIHNLHKIPADLVKKVKELEVAKKAKQDRDVKRGKLIERKIVKQVFAQIHMVDTNQWKTLENKIIPEMCSILKFQDGGDQALEARKMITTEVNKILKFTKRLIDEFFEKNEED